MDFERVEKWDSWGEPRVDIELTDDELKSEINDKADIIEKRIRRELEDLDPYHL